MNKLSLNKIKFKKPEDPTLPFQDPIEIFCAQRFKGYYLRGQAVEIQDNLYDKTLNILGKITIPAQFHQWAVKQLKEEHAKEKIDRDEITQAHRHNLDACTKKLDTLFNMRLNEEIGPEEYARKKDDLLREKQKYEELIGDTQHRIETWLERAEKTFSFAETAQKRFQTGTVEDKRHILSCLGSNFVLAGKQLQIQVDKSLALFQEVAPEVQRLHRLSAEKAGLEPAQVVDSQRDWEALYAQNKNWGRWLNQVRTCFL